MITLPEEVSKAWESHAGPVVLTTVDSNGIPNAIYATCTRKYSDDTWIVADNFFSKTRANILAGSSASLLFITADNKSYQLKGKVCLYTEGAIFDDMKQWNPEHLPGHAAAALTVEHIFSGAVQLV